MMMKSLGLDDSMSNLTSTLSGETSISSNTRNNNNNESSSTTATATANTSMLYPQQASTSSFTSLHQAPPPQLPPAKKKRSLPGNPDPEAEVIALSPKSLLATNRFMCEICNKGFQRDQNLQLHRRGHNLPWKLKQRANKDQIRKKVYVCPEPSCVHHDPARALGDLTGIKKHFCRKHGEKKWKCEKCSKKYAVQSDWKAHSKICGTREYRCDCGTLFSRRDSFITHRAFCDALAEESARAINPLTLPSLPQAATSAVGGGGTSSTLPHLSQFSSHLTSSHHHHQVLQSLPLKREQDHHNHHSFSIPPWLACPPPPHQQPLNHHQPHPVGAGPGPGPPSQMESQQHHLEPSSHLFSSFQQYSQQSPAGLDGGPTLSSFQAPPPHPQMSATALLQKAAEMGVTASTNNQHPPNQHQHQLHHQMSSSPHALFVSNNNNNNNNKNHQQQQEQSHMSSALAGLSSSREGEHHHHHHPQHHHQAAAVLTNSTAAATSTDGGFMEGEVLPNEGGEGGGSVAAQSQSSMLHDMMMMSSLQSNGFDVSGFGDFHHHQGMNAGKPTQLEGGNRGGGGGGDGLTRDFLGLRTFSHKDFLNMAGQLAAGHMSSSSAPSYEQHDQNQTPW